MEGAATAGWAICAHFILLDYPANTKRFSAREREIAINRLQADNVSSVIEEAPRLTSLQAVVTALGNWRLWLLTVGYMVGCFILFGYMDNTNNVLQVIVGSSTLSYFYPTLVAGLGYTSHMAQYMVRACIRSIRDLRCVAIILIV